MIETEIVTFPLLVFSQLEECRKNAATFFKKVIILNLISISTWVRGSRTKKVRLKTTQTVSNDIEYAYVSGINEK